MNMRLNFMVLICIACAVVARRARAQTEAPPPAAPAASQGTAGGGDGGGFDHDRFKGHFAVGYMGLSSLPIGNATGTPDTPLVAPVIGGRYWFPDRIFGVDAGLGFYTTSGSSQSTSGGVTVSTDHESKTGFALHGGVPFALATGRHYVFEVVPELNVGFTTGTIKNPGMPDTSVGGFRFDLGARAGCEIHFGFMNVPELALQASVGLFLTRTSTSASTGPSSGGDGTWLMTTSLVDDPWQIFVANIQALYYF